MASWRCPHCGAPQPETERCWVCRRSTTSCATCRHFRKAVAVRLGYCALDKKRMPLTGAEERDCWERAIAETPGAAPVFASAADQAAQGRGLWGTPLPAEASPDRDVRSHGMWAETDSSPAPKRVPNQHGGSVRSRPWGPVPGLRDEGTWRRGIRVR